MPSEGAPGPSNLFADDAEDDGVVLRTTLRRASTGKFNLVFKHDSKTGEVAISQVGASDTPDGRKNVHTMDHVLEVNGHSTQGLSVSEVQQLVSEAGDALDLVLEHGHEEEADEEKSLRRGGLRRSIARGGPPPPEEDEEPSEEEPSVSEDLSFQAEIEAEREEIAALEERVHAQQQQAPPTRERKGSVMRSVVRALSFEPKTRRKRRESQAQESATPAATGIVAHTGSAVRKSVSFDHKPGRQRERMRQTSEGVVITQDQPRLVRSVDPDYEDDGPFAMNYQPIPPGDGENEDGSLRPEIDGTKGAADGHLRYNDFEPSPSRRMVPSRAQSNGIMPQRTLGCVLESFAAETAVELSVRRGEIIVLLSDGAPKGWSWACSPTGAGLVPTDFVQFLDVPTRRPQQQQVVRSVVQDMQQGGRATPPPSSPQPLALMSSMASPSIESPAETRGARASSPGGTPPPTATQPAHYDRRVLTGMEGVAVKTTVPTPDIVPPPDFLAPASAPAPAAPAAAPTALGKTPSVRARAHVAGFLAAVEAAEAEEEEASTLPPSPAPAVTLSEALAKADAVAAVEEAKPPAPDPPVLFDVEPSPPPPEPPPPPPPPEEEKKPPTPSKEVEQRAQAIIARARSAQEPQLMENMARLKAARAESPAISETSTPNNTPPRPTLYIPPPAPAAPATPPRAYGRGEGPDAGAYLEPMEPPRPGTPVSSSKEPTEVEGSSPVKAIADGAGAVLRGLTGIWGSAAQLLGGGSPNTQRQAADPPATVVEEGEAEAAGPAPAPEAAAGPAPEPPARHAAHAAHYHAIHENTEAAYV